jgi:hypothetical protein
LHRLAGHSGVTRLLAHRGKGRNFKQPVVGPVRELPRMIEVDLRQCASRLNVEAHPREEQYPLGDRGEKRKADLFAVVRPRQSPDVRYQVPEQGLAVTPAADVVVRFPESRDLRAKAPHGGHVNPQGGGMLKWQFPRVGGYGGGEPGDMPVDRTDRLVAQRRFVSEIRFQQGVEFVDCGLPGDGTRASGHICSPSPA